MPIPGDLRALDARATIKSRCIGVEAQTQLFDVQATARKALLKKRDAKLDVILLLVADTVANRRILAEHRASLRGSFPLDSRAIFRALSQGDPPQDDGIAVL